MFTKNEHKDVMKIRREWAMPNKDTFNVQPIRIFVEKYLDNSIISIDPFSRNKRWATHTNDLNPSTKAEHHMDALSFLKMLYSSGVRADLVIFDPPYSLNQCKQSYENIGITTPSDYATNSIRWTKEKNVLTDIIKKDGCFLHFGWHSNGMGMKRGFTIDEVLLVAHGGAHYDTICLAERKTSEQLKLF